VVIWPILASDDFKSIIFYIISLSEISHKQENGIKIHLRGVGYATEIFWLGKNPVGGNCKLRSNSTTSVRDEKSF
jgi:hypothetical protein